MRPTLTRQAHVGAVGDALDRRRRSGDVRGGAGHGPDDRIGRVGHRRVEAPAPPLDLRRMGGEPGVGRGGAGDRVFERPPGRGHILADGDAVATLGDEGVGHTARPVAGAHGADLDRPRQAVAGEERRAGVAGDGGARRPPPRSARPPVAAAPPAAARTTRRRSRPPRARSRARTGRARSGGTSASPPAPGPLAGASVPRPRRRARCGRGGWRPGCPSRRPPRPPRWRRSGGPAAAARRRGWPWRRTRRSRGRPSCPRRRGRRPGRPAGPGPRAASSRRPHRRRGPRRCGR